MVRDYELLYIARPELDDEGVRSAVQSVRGIVEAQGGEIVKTTLWGKRRLAYEVRRLRDGHYVLVVLRLDGSKVAAVERALRIHETVFRHLLVLHEGEMPEPDPDIDVSAAGAPPEVTLGETDSASDVGAPSAATEEDGEDGFDEAPSASDDEGDV
jgi:small subunit ribosomal protein S6